LLTTVPTKNRTFEASLATNFRLVVRNKLRVTFHSRPSLTLSSVQGSFYTAPSTGECPVHTNGKQTSCMSFVASLKSATKGIQLVAVPTNFENKPTSRIGSGIRYFGEHARVIWTAVSRSQLCPTET